MLPASTSTASAFIRPSVVRNETQIILLQPGQADSTHFNIILDGAPECRRLLLPEDGILLEQNPFNANSFKFACQTLPSRERQAIEKWNKGEFPDDIRHHGLVPETRHCMHAPYPHPAEWASMRDLSSALRRLPALPGEYLRVETYPDAGTVPWGKTIQVGDIVSGYPGFLSASSRDDHAKRVVLELARQTCPYAIAFCKFTASTEGVPIEPLPTSPADATTVLFPRYARFLVNSIVIAETRSPVFPAVRIGILLEPFHTACHHGVVPAIQNQSRTISAPPDETGIHHNTGNITTGYPDYPEAVSTRHHARHDH